MNPATTFKCLTNTNGDPTPTRLPAIKPKFSKLTLSSSNKKQPPPQLTAATDPDDDPAHTPTPKMLSFEPELTDDEDEPTDGVNGQQRVSPINKILESSASNTTPPPLPPPNAGLANACEGPSFSQRLQMNDTDVTNCTELNARRSSIRPSLSTVAAAAVAVPVVVAPAALADEPNSTYNQTVSQMERLEITASSEDLFAGSGDDGNSRNSSQLQQQQHHSLPEEISNLSACVEQINLLSSESLAAKAPRCRPTVFSVSSSSSYSSASNRSAAVLQRSTRSSLASSDVYDVITLSDSQSEADVSVDDEAHAGNAVAEAAVAADDDADQAPGIVSLPAVADDDDGGDSLCNLSSVRQAAVADSASSLPSSVQHRLDNFFDNIPMLSSDPPEPQSDPSPPVAADAQTLHSNSSVYVSETDEDADGSHRSAADVREASVELPPADGQPIPCDTPKSPTVAPEASDNDAGGSSEMVPLSSEPVITTQSTQPSTITSSVRKAFGSRTPIVNIAAKFQIRIQVNHNDDDTTSESSSATSGHDASATSSRSSCADTEPPPAPTPADVAVREQTDRLSEMHIEAQQPAAAAAVTPLPVGKKLQLDKLKTPKTKRPPSPVGTPSAMPAADDMIRPPPCTPARTPDKPKIVLDSAAQQLLNELYGATWQTPDLLKKCVIRRPSVAPATAVKAPPAPASSVAARLPATAGKEARSAPRTNAQRQQPQQQQRPSDGALADLRCSQDFSLFRKHIASDLDSTRIGDLSRVAPAAAVVSSPFFRKPAEPTTPVYRARRSSMDAIKSSKKKVPNRIADSDESSEDDTVPSQATPAMETPVGRSVRRCRLNATKQVTPVVSSDNSGDDNDQDKENLDDLISDDTDDEWQQAQPKNRSKNSSGSSSRSNRSRRPRANCGDLTYLDLTHAEVVEDECHGRPDASDADLEAISRKLLADFEFVQPKPFEPFTPAKEQQPADAAATRTKRKLYNPAYEDLEHAARELCSPHNITQVRVDLPQQASLDEADVMVDDPKFRVRLRGNVLPRLLQIPRIGDLRNGEPAEQRTPKGAGGGGAKRTPAATPGTPTTLAEISRTPDGKYSFLQSLDVHVSKHLLHPVALSFRERFKSRKPQLTALLLQLYTERVFGGGAGEQPLAVPVTWNKKLLTTAGLCINRRRAGVRTATIELSEKVITSADRLRCTLIHELCHAATWVYQGESGHGAAWKRWAGLANARRPELPPIVRCHAYDIEYKYIYQCVLCGAKSPAHSKSKKVERIRCAYCHGAIEIYLNKRNGAGEVCPTPVRKATGFAAFVKVEYRNCKQPGVSHAEVMRLLSGLYAKLTPEQKKAY